MNKPAADLSAPPRWAWHERSLRRLRKNLQAECRDVDEMFRTTAERGGEDLIDRANERVAREVLLAEHTAHGQALKEIDEALERMARGTYGICEETGQLIEPARLRALPWTRYSFAAATRLEGRRGKS